MENKGKFHKNYKKKNKWLEIRKSRKEIEIIKQNKVFKKEQDLSSTAVNDIDANRRRSTLRMPHDHKEICFLCGGRAANFYKITTLRQDQKVWSGARVFKDSELLAKLSNGNMMQCIIYLV